MIQLTKGRVVVVVVVVREARGDEGVVEEGGDDRRVGEAVVREVAVVSRLVVLSVMGRVNQFLDRSASWLRFSRG